MTSNETPPKGLNPGVISLKKHQVNSEQKSEEGWGPGATNIKQITSCDHMTGWSM